MNPSEEKRKYAWGLMALIATAALLAYVILQAKPK